MFTEAMAEKVRVDRARVVEEYHKYTALAKKALAMIKEYEKILETYEKGGYDENSSNV